MITVETSGPSDVVEIRVAAPFAPEDFAGAGRRLQELRQRSPWNVLLVVDSLELPEPRALWEDIKLTPYVRDIKRAAVVTDIGWYGKLAEIVGDVWPGMDIERFEPGERAAALAWLSRPQD